MLFTSYTFVLFALAVAALYYLVPAKAQNLILLLASIYFYWYTMPKFLPLLLTTGTVCYFAAIILEDKERKGRKALLIFFLLLFLAPLFIYKYLGFFSSMVLSTFGMPASTLALALPLGISFYTFQALGYIIDCYTGGMKAQRNLITCLLFITFFPQLMSGPIGRAKELMPQYSRRRPVSVENLKSAGVRFLVGLFKKVAIADNLGRFVDLYYRHPASYGTADVTLLVIAFYTLQLFFDFAGYSDMAIATGQLFGISLPENFSVPYLASSYREFWNWWHMSLTGWFRDYLYIPLGGNRKGSARKWINVMIVFLVSGLWHGAAVTFLIWGLLQGLLRIVDEFVIPKEKLHPKTVLSHAARAFVVVLCWGLSLVFFRADSMGTAMEAFRYLTVIPSPHMIIDNVLNFLVITLGGTGVYEKLTLLLLAASILLAAYLELRAYVAPKGDKAAVLPVVSLPEWVRVAVYCFMFFTVAAIGRFGTSSFIYFNF